MNDNRMKRVRVMLETRSDGGGETLDGKGGYEFRKSGSRLYFTADGASFELLTGNDLRIVRKGVFHRDALRKYSCGCSNGQYANKLFALACRN